MIDRGGEEAALAAMKKNIAVMYFAEVRFPVRDVMPGMPLCSCIYLYLIIRKHPSAEGQIQSAGEVLQRKLGKERQEKTGVANVGNIPRYGWIWIDIYIYGRYDHDTTQHGPTVVEI